MLSYLQNCRKVSTCWLLKKKKKEYMLSKDRGLTAPKLGIQSASAIVVFTSECVKIKERQSNGKWSTVECNTAN